MPFILHYLEAGGDYPTWLEPYNHMSTARKQATKLALLTNKRVQISRVLPEDKVVACLIVGPDGTAERPLHSQPVSRREDCTRGTGRACFCSPCRAARKEDLK